MSVTTAGELGATPLNRSLGLAEIYVRAAEPAFRAERQITAATVYHALGSVAVVNSLLDPSQQMAPRRHRIQERKPGMVDGPGGLDKFFGPSDGFVIFDQIAEKRRVGRDGSGCVEIAMVCCPPKRGAQIGQLDSEPVVSLPLAGGVPQGHDVWL